jgi:hypothetical protein
MKEQLFLCHEFSARSEDSLRAMFEGHKFMGVRINDLGLNFANKKAGL